MLIVEVERGKDGDKERPIAEISMEHGMAAFHAQLICQALNKHVNENSHRYYKVIARTKTRKELT